MATTFKISDGDTVVNTSTGRPKLIGNVINENNPVKAREKATQDMRRCLSIGRIKNGTGAGITELVGIVDGGILSISTLLRSRIRNMFSALINVQRKDINTRPLGERLRTITVLQVIPDTSSKTAYRFRLDTKTFSNETIVQSGTITF